jgi:ATP-dependent Clp protease ATP-binding subunit ClpA
MQAAMSHVLHIPFLAFRLHFNTGAKITIPLKDKEVMSIGEPMQLLARRYAAVLQKELLNKGQFELLLQELTSGDFYKSSIIVSFPAAADGVSYPAFELSFDYFFNPQANGYWAIVPALGVEAYATDDVELTAQLNESIRMAFNRKKKLSAVQRIVSAIWFDFVELLQAPLELQAPTPAEIDRLADAPEEEWLPQIAQLLQVKDRQLYGLDKELNDLLGALKDQFNNNVLLVGPSGVGKTTLVWEVARQLEQTDYKRKIWETTASVLIKELANDTDWQDNIAYLCKELTALGDWLFVRNLADLFEVGRSVGNVLSVAEYLQSYISRGEITLIAECTEEELARIELQSPQFLTLFKLIRVVQPQAKALEDIIFQKVLQSAAISGMQVNEDGVKELIRLTSRFNPYSGLPGKPIRFMERLLSGQLRSDQTAASASGIITRTDVIRAFCEESGLPLFMVDPEISLQLSHIEDFFQRNLFGQSLAIERVINLMASVKTALTRSGQPIASLLFVGPTGVGKTEMAKLVAEFMFGDRRRMQRFDMSEFADFLSVARLTGLDSQEEGLLTAAIRKSPFSVVLFDEIEKADASFYDLLLQILSEGRLTDSKGNVINFCSCIIILTSNLGAEKLRYAPVSLQKSGQPRQDLQDAFIKEAQRFFRPELYNRIDQVLVFSPLDSELMRSIVNREIEGVLQREGIKFRRLDLTIVDEVYEYLSKEGYHPQYGARHLQRAIRQFLLIPLAKALNAQDAEERIIVNITMKSDALHVDAHADPEGLELLIAELEKDSYAEYAGFLRRQIHALAEGHCYVHLVNEIALLERQQQQQSSAFWQQEQLVRKLNALYDLQKKMNSLQQQIETVESSLCLARLGLEKFNPAVQQYLEDWENQLKNFKLDLLGKMFPQYNYCHLGIYGADIEPLLQIYLDLLSQKGWKYSAQLVWYRESYYHEMVASTNQPRQPREAYLKTPVSGVFTEIPAPSMPGDLCCGIELAISGLCAQLFFQSEGGVQRWTDAQGKDSLYLVTFNQEALQTPVKIHRQETYRKLPPRRIVSPVEWRDTVYKIKFNQPEKSPKELLWQQLDIQFSLHVDSSL